jgi:hypothetical protein
MESNLNENLYKKSNEFDKDKIKYDDNIIFDEVNLSIQKDINKSEKEIPQMDNDNNSFLRITLNENIQSIKDLFLSKRSNDENEEDNIMNSRSLLQSPNKNLKFIDIINCSETNLMQNTLLAMGFELKIINNVLKYLHITSIEMAIEYLSKSDEKWNHPFVSGFEENKDNICLICSEFPDFHLDYSLHKSRISSTELIRTYSNDININNNSKQGM